MSNPEIIVWDGWEDKEWDDAVALSKSEGKYYYKCRYNGRIFYKYYNPSLAKLVQKRTGWTMERVGG